MLNEVKEYQCYLCEDTAQVPLQQSSLEKRVGFRRPLRILAKGFLQKCEAKNLDRQKSIHYCRGFLKTWVEGTIPDGLVDQDFDGELLTDLKNAQEHNLLHHAENLQRSSLTLNGKTLDVSKLDERMAKLENDIKNYDEPAYQKSWNLTRNDFNRIYYDQIIADALNRKPLREQYLALRMKNDKLYGLSCEEKMRKIALAVVCMYLQDLDEYDRPVISEYLPVVQAEVGNWTHCRVQKNGKNTKTTCVVRAIDETKLQSDKSQSLFDKQRMANSIRLKVNQQWLGKEHDVKLVNKTDVNELPDGYVLFDDSFFQKNNDT